ncbi:hypothetical protein [Undibacterium danionis]|uniref:Uncharacterized protein n=1 Tax=Undibacterium danionis TaxID=1812100 RepID=A0ABV6IDL8_9BURK
MKIFACFLSLVLIGCGGGTSTGGTSTGGAGSQVTAPDNGLSLSPSSISLKVFKGESFSTDVLAILNRDFGSEINIKIEDDKGIIQPQIKLVISGTKSATATLVSKPDLLAGVYDGKIKISLCKDALCSQLHQGSPWFLPYRLEVMNFAETKDMTALGRITKQENWTSPQVNITNASYLDVTIDPTKILPRFSKSTEFGDLSFALPSSDGLVYIVNNDLDISVFGTGYRSQLIAVDEQTGSVRWAYKLLYGKNKIGQPLILGDNIYIYKGYSDSTFANVSLLVIDKQTGVLKAEYRQDVFLEFLESKYLPAPSIDPFKLQLNSLIYKNESYGAELYTSSGIFTYKPEEVHTIVNGLKSDRLGQLMRNNRDGASSVAVSNREYDNQLYGMTNFYPIVRDGLRPVLHSQSEILVHEASRSIPDRFLINFDWNRSTQKWDKSGFFRSAVAIRGNEFYVVNFNQVEGRRTSDGSLLWSWVIPGETQGVISGKLPYDPSLPSSQTFGDHLFNEEILNLFVTNNLLFIGMREHVYAIDTSTHKMVWSFPRGGFVSMSNSGVLYLANSMNKKTSLLRSKTSISVQPMLFAFNTR